MCAEWAGDAGWRRWESLAEAHFAIDGEIADDNYVYCLCSRVFIRGAKLYQTDKGEGSESDRERGEHSHVHFSQDTSYKEKYEKEEVASCYCSASHTDNNYSTDEHDTNAPAHAPLSRTIQTSDSGADLTYQEGHSDSHNLSQSTRDHTPADEYCPMLIEHMEEDLVPILENVDTNYIENYLSNDTWEKYWQVNGERLIWASWINTYSDYINPSYLETENSLPKEHSADQIYTLCESDCVNKLKQDSIRERKFSYDSKVNPYKKRQQVVQKNSTELMCNTDEWMPVARKRSCSEHERLLSPRTVTATDSMTNVTKMSSYGIESSHVTSESSKSDDYSVSSSSSAEQSNDQTRVYIEDASENSQEQEEMDTDQYWQLLWKKHFGEQYAMHYANYIECHTVCPNNDITTIKDEAITQPVIQETHSKRDEVKHEKEGKSEAMADIECENSDGNSQELPSVVEVQKKVTNIKLDDEKPKKNKKNSRYLDSVGFLLHNLLNQEKKKCEELQDGNDTNKSKDGDGLVKDEADGSVSNVAQGDYSSSSNVSPRFNDGDDEPPEKRQIELKRSHESDTEEIAAEKISSTFTQIGLSWDPLGAPQGLLVYRKRTARLRPPRPKKINIPKKTYFDDDGRPYTMDKAAEESNEMQTDEDCPQVKSDEEEPSGHPSTGIVKGTDLDESSELPEHEAESAAVDRIKNDTGLSDCAEIPSESVKRKRRKRRKSITSTAIQLPEELADDPKMIKYWQKRHSLFLRFDEGIILDKESWFSVTPEKVAKHLAERCRCDLIVDAFCGAGGNAIQFALTCERVIAIDIDPTKIEMARHNAAVYGLADRIEFIVGDFFQVAPTLKGDVVFLSPPWGGPQYNKEKQYDLETMLEPKPSSELMEAAQNISNNIALYVPRSSRSEQLISLAQVSGAVEIEQNFLGRRLVALTAYYGDLVNY